MGLACPAAATPDPGRRHGGPVLGASRGPAGPAAESFAGRRAQHRAGRGRVGLHGLGRAGADRRVRSRTGIASAGPALLAARGAWARGPARKPAPASARQHARAGPASVEDRVRVSVSLVSAAASPSLAIRASRRKTWQAKARRGPNPHVVSLLRAVHDPLHNAVIR